MYADDTLLICNDTDINKVTEKAQTAFQNMAAWCDANKLTINVDKTKFMIIKHNKTQTEPTFVSNCNRISTVHQFEYLGFCLDDKLSINEYLDVIWKKANAKIGILSKIRHFLSEKTAIRIYKTMIRPHLDYVDFVVDSGSATRIKKLDTLEKKAIRRIEYCMNVENRQGTNVLLEKHKIEELKLRCKRNLLKIMYSQSLCETNLKKVTTDKNLRSTNKVKLDNNFTSKTKVLNSPLYRGVRLWDKLPTDIQKETDKYTFRKKISNYTF